MRELDLNMNQTACDMIIIKNIFLVFFLILNKSAPNIITGIETAMNSGGTIMTVNI